MPSLIDDIQAEQIPMEVYFRHLHQHPELAFEETESAAYIADLLRQWGYEVTEGIGGTGVVARMQLGDGTTSIGLRADTDALPVPEMTDLPYKSKVAGKSHTCGHDAHTTMLLGAAQYLARKGNFNGTLNLIFQPAEEIMAGAPAMLGDDLLRRFPMDYMFGLHNMPGLEAGTLYLTAGPVMAAVDNWEIELTGKGGHGSMPERCIDPLVAGSALVMSLQTIVSRNVAAQDAVVVTIGAFNSGEAGNVIPQNAVLRLSVRSRDPDTRTRVLDRIRAITAATAEGYNVGFEIREGQPGAVLVNDDEQTRICTEVACRLLGEERVVNPGPTFMGSEDFAFFAQQRPSVYGFLGNGDTPMVHHPEYAFDPANLPVGAAYWVAITQHYLR
ncbi:MULTISPECIES: M20 aminoacylase family protein [Marinobacter]|uniref:Amidohydrolase n=1 Tax=Marinobacter profundi TaxID=2666256 RepID=A0A2G1UN86_9GAMM|nr:MULTISPECIES: M20 aminoacylase family protein [Marinobacter]MBD3658638.1 amidohydrolase [Marinobacter sp.]PHQ15905.1 amidohydrolase [Marinobacter profundi]